MIQSWIYFCNSVKELFTRLLVNVFALSPELWSAIAALLSFLLAFRIERYNKNKNQKRANTELYSLISILIGFIDFVQYTFLHNTSTMMDCANILKKIYAVDKNILDYNKAYFYNDEYDEKVLLKTAVFIQQYVAWRGYHCAMELDCFSEMNQMFALQRSAIEAISEIVSVYKARDNKISILLTEEAMSKMNWIYNHNKVLVHHFVSIKNNLYFLKSNEALTDLYKIYQKQEFQISKLMPACYQLAVVSEPFYPYNHGELLKSYQFFFNSQITQFNDIDNKGKKECCLFNNVGDKIEIEAVFKLLHCLSN